ncbi:helix-turn-helix transcriptional regulator [Micromonospora sp. WMMD1102]|uniref:PadR family transcriptional regulator n=1 Tax=Micromonospora sp. WMMD1102 TaxID=3016105 RepID=UPI002414E79B|nr:helix-turn-helix transcriptional regulator [Micromonospora sp. WMMD1102]MDG4788505.1 helix-turn-helix transcriptional regulator [Micromonospora sp. WMMD1102]
MTPPIRITTTLVRVLEVFLDDPTVERYGLDVMRVTGYPSGTIYPILTRLLGAGWLDAHWEDIDPVSAGRPARRWFRLTPDGVQSARAQLAAYRQRHAPQRGTVNLRPTWES